MGRVIVKRRKLVCRSKVISATYGGGGGMLSSFRNCIRARACVRTDAFRARAFLMISSFTIHTQRADTPGPTSRVIRFLYRPGSFYAIITDGSPSKTSFPDPGAVRVTIRAA